MVAVFEGMAWVCQRRTGGNESERAEISSSSGLIVMAVKGQAFVSATPRSLCFIMTYSTGWSPKGLFLTGGGHA